MILLDFFIEIYNRLRTKSPKIFFVLQVFSASLIFLGYVPSMMQRWFGVEVSGYMITFCEDVSKYATGFFAAVQIPVRTKPVAQTEGGDAVIVTDENKMPFTSKSEIAETKKTIPPIPVVDVPENK